MSLAMSKEERQTFLADLHVGIVSIPRKGQAPLAVPIWYDYSPGGKLWMLTGAESKKGKALLECERISLCAQTESPPYSYVSVEGQFEITESSSEIGLKMAVRYLGEEMGRQYSENSGGEQSVMVSFTPDKWLTVDYSKM
jgi:nitroimidazol reductase NimA-like FMN-containing flavoprotein (pyridoxamine 5'-phosphate oxidase superfamily)